MKVIYQRLFLVVIIITIGGLSGFWLKTMHYRSPLSSESDVTHYCSCIEDNPRYQRLALVAADKVNELIDRKTQDFIKLHNLDRMDFDASFIPTGNGNYRIKTLCSNRSSKVYGLYDRYKDLVQACLVPHKEMIKIAHADHSE